MMQEASFSIKDYRIDRVMIDMSKDNGTNELDVNFVPECHFSRSKKTAEVIFEVQVQNKSGGEAFCAIKSTGIFQFSDSMTPENIPPFFFQNSIAILFPYIRAYVSIITVQSNIKHVMLPTFNLSSLSPILQSHFIIDD